MLTALRRRWWLVVLSTCLSALASWLVVRGNPAIYERTASLLLRPAPDLDEGSYSDALSAIQRETLGIEPTLLSVIGSDEFLAAAVARAEITPSVDYSIRPTMRPSADVVDLRLRGPNASSLVELERMAVLLSEEWLADQYNDAYSFEPLDSSAADGPVLPAVTRSVRLGGVLGALLGLAIVAAEARFGARGRAARTDPKPSA